MVVDDPAGRVFSDAARPKYPSYRWVLVERIDAALQMMRKPGVVAIEKRDVAAAGVFQTGIARTIGSLIRLADELDGAGERARFHFHDSGGVIAAAVVNDDELPIGK